ncbi:MAG: hypothetical protein A2148_07295 [Chloroflexi bacterium RBG_16_68_14]|nr:MAG: hypothetical protein A2148_07295 [Chloroflexi bacterium RBG_16_68_14]
MTTTAERLRSYWGERQIDRERLVTLAVRHWEVALYAALIGLALGLRLWGLAERAIHHDESLHMLYGWDIFKGKGYDHVPFMHGPFKYFGTALMFRLFGDTDFTARLLPALFGSALVGLPFFLRSYLGRAGALIAAALLAFSPTLFYLSRFNRDDILITAYTLAMVIVIWRYLKEQQERYLYLVPVLLMLGFVTMEVTFITTAIFLVYLEFQLATDLVDQLRASRPLAWWQVALAYVVFLPGGWLIAILWPLLKAQRERWSLTTLPPAGHLAIVIATFALPLFAAGIQKIPLLSLGDADIYEDPPGPEPLMQVSVLMFFLVSAYIGLLWNRRVWAIGAVMFYVPYFLLYTTFFTNGGDVWNPNGQFWSGEGGFWTGIWGSLDYWLSQQLVRRGSQPDYYYLMTLPVYEFLPLVFALGGALFYAFRGKLEQKLLSAAALLLVFMFSVMPESFPVLGQYHIQVSFLIAIGAVLLLSMDAFTKFLLFWTLSMLFGITVAGEKMPWLTVHVALPLAILAAKVLDDVLSAVVVRPAAVAAESRPAQGRREREQREEVKGPSTLERVLPLVYGAVLALAAAVLFQAFGPASGISIMPWLLSIVALGVVLWAGTMVSWRAAGQVAAVALFAALLVFTVRAGMMAAYDQGEPDGYPQEILIYAQGSPKVGLINDEIDRLARESGLGRDLKIIIDNSVNVWPWPWYLRDRPYELNNFDTDFSPPPGSVVLISNANQAKIQPFLDQYQDPIPYTHMWWFPEFYRGLETDDFLKDFFSGGLLSTWRGYFIDRIVPGATSTPDMLAYFPKGGFVPVIPPPPQVPGTAEALPEESLTVIGSAGSEAGQFSQPADLALDAQGNLYVVDTLNHRIQKFTSDGEVLTLGKAGTGEGQFANPRSAEYEVDDGPWGIAVDAEGNIYVADTWNHRIQKFSPDLEFILEWGAGDFFGPRDVAIDSEGNVLVADTGNKRVVKYTPEGQLIQVYGKAGDDAGDFIEPSGISVAPNGHIYVADFWNQRIQHFDATFEYIDEISVPSWGSQGITDRAYIAALPDGRVLATDPANGRILVFNPAGDEEAAWRLPSDTGTRPVGITVGALGAVYVSDGLTSQVVRLPLTALLATPAPAP